MVKLTLVLHNGVTFARNHDGIENFKIAEFFNQKGFAIL